MLSPRYSLQLLSKTNPPCSAVSAIVELLVLVLYTGLIILLQHHIVRHLKYVDLTTGGQQRTEI